MSDEYPLMAFIANEGVAPKGERYDRSALVTDTVNKLYKKTEKGDFIYSSNNLETGSIGLNKYGKACISPVYSIFEPTGIADSDFLGRRLVRKDFINAMVKWRQGVIYGQWRIHESDFLKIEISVPSVEEQRKIGAYLDQLDNLITLHQRKCIFFTGRAGRLISTVNKKRITSSWEQRKLGDMMNVTSVKRIHQSDWTDSGVRFLRANAYHHQLLPLMQGIKVLSLSRSNIQKTSVSYPIAVKEQQLIAYYFSQLDNLITLHQRQTIVYAVIRSIRKVILAERQYFAPPMVRKSP